MRHLWIAVWITLGILAFGPACRADDVSVGLFAHDVPLMGQRVHEGGAEAVVALGGDPISLPGVLGKPSPYVVVGANLEGKTDFVAAGLRWKVDLSKRAYVKAGVGLALNDAPHHAIPGRIDAGSSLTFEPEASLGWKVRRNVAVEATIIHLSQARLFSPKNPGINELGVRVVVRFDQGGLLRQVRRLL